MSETKYLTAAEVAPVLRITPYAVSELCRTNALRASKPGKSWLITPADLEAYIAAGRNRAEAS